METNYTKARLEKLRHAMQEKQIDALFLMNKSNVRYLSAFTGDDSYLLLTGRAHGSKNYFITDSRYIDQAASECKEYEIIKYRDPLPPLAETVALLCRENGVSALGFEKSHIPYHLYESMQQACGGDIAFIPTEALVAQLRAIKDAQEISLLRQACLYTDQVFSAICEFICPGRTEKEVEWQLFCLFHEFGCESSFPPIVVSGKRGAMPHGSASDKPLCKGEFLTMDFGCMYQGYHADLTRTVHIGPADSFSKKIYDIVLEANLRAEAAAKAGMPANALDSIARNHIAAHGYGSNFGHSLGHGVGLDIHEQPFVSPRSQALLPSNSFITIEPGIYLSDWGGIRIEDTVLLTEDGIENMFTSTKELICL